MRHCICAAGVPLNLCGYHLGLRLSVSWPTPACVIFDTLQIQTKMTTSAVIQLQFGFFAANQFTIYTFTLTLKKLQVFAPWPWVRPCSPVFTTVYGTAHSSDCHSYLHCKYGKQCSGRELKITPPRASVTKLINRGMGVEQVLTTQVSLSLSHHVPFFSALLSYFPLPLFRLWPNKAQLHGGSFIHYRHGPRLLFVDS